MSMPRIHLPHEYENIISLENLLEAWKEFVNGKRDRKDVRAFELNLMDNLLRLRASLVNKTYRHGGYVCFKISDPKPRIIHKASVRDRLLHHAIHRKLYPFFDRTLISDSYSCRDDKGIHKALNRFRKFFRQVSRNDTRTAWVLKCDIKKFFASIQHEKLMSILSERISDPNILLLLQEIIGSFEVTSGIGLPLGNLTSQLFANVYMNELDQFVKHRLKVKQYIRYADDFVFLSHDRHYLEDIISELSSFLEISLGLTMHPDKVFIKTVASGVDFLGWIHFSNHRILRSVTKRRMFLRLRDNPTSERLSSYRGLLSHGNTRKLSVAVEDLRNVRKAVH